MAENVREIVLDILLTLEREELFSNKLIKAVLDKYDYLSMQEKSFIKRVAEGTIERQLELDYYLDACSKVPVKKMKPLIRCLLRMSVYQILYMDGVPDSAVCNEACKLAGKRKFINLKGFVNGVLRSIAAKKNHLPLPDKSTQTALYLSIKYSTPEWLVTMWLSLYGCDMTERILKGLLLEKPVSLRFSTALTQEERDRALEDIKAHGADLRQSEYLPYVYLAKNTEAVNSLPGFAEGRFMVQDVSSALAVEAAGIQRKDFVVDVCAAPGGKSLLAAQKAGKVLARDVRENKCALIEENVKRMQADNVTVQVFDATVLDESLIEQADVLLLDVPCSGLGVMGKKQDIKYHAEKESLKELVALQRQIVEACWQYVKPGGTLLYSTCTINPSENEDMVKWILETFPFEPGQIDAYIPRKLREETEEIQRLLISLGKVVDRQAADCSVQLLPGFMCSDGFFFARLTRKQ